MLSNKVFKLINNKEMNTNKNVIRLTEAQLSEMIKDITMKVGRVERERNHDTQGDRSNDSDNDVFMSALEKHKTVPFMFFANNGRDFGFRVIFELSSALKIEADEIVLDGIVIFDREQRYGKISIKNGIAKYRKGNVIYPLTPDNRTKQAWDDLLDDIQKRN